MALKNVIIKGSYKLGKAYGEKKEERQQTQQYRRRVRSDFEAEKRAENSRIKRERSEDRERAKLSRIREQEKARVYRGQRIRASIKAEAKKILSKPKSKPRVATKRVYKSKPKTVTKIIYRNRPKTKTVSRRYKPKSARKRPTTKRRKAKRSSDPFDFGF